MHKITTIVEPTTLSAHQWKLIMVKWVYTSWIYYRTWVGACPSTIKAWVAQHMGSHMNGVMSWTFWFQFLMMKHNLCCMHEVFALCLGWIWAS